MERFTKQVSEEFTITGEFSENMSDAETITAQAVVARDKNGDDVSAIVLDQSTVQVVNQGVEVKVRAGEVASEPYVITFTCTTDYPHKWEIDVKMRVKDL